MNLSLSEDKDADPCASSSKSMDPSTNITAAFSDKVSDAVRMLNIVWTIFQKNMFQPRTQLLQSSFAAQEKQSVNATVGTDDDVRIFYGNGHGALIFLVVPIFRVA